jgi:hypothetical protein
VKANRRPVWGAAPPRRDWNRKPLISPWRANVFSERSKLAAISKVCPSLLSWRLDPQGSCGLDLSMGISLGTRRTTAARPLPQTHPVNPAAPCRRRRRLRNMAPRALSPIAHGADGRKYLNYSTNRGSIKDTRTLAKMCKNFLDVYSHLLYIQPTPIRVRPGDEVAAQSRCERSRWIFTKPPGIQLKQFREAALQKLEGKKIGPESKWI